MKGGREAASTRDHPHCQGKRPALFAAPVKSHFPARRLESAGVHRCRNPQQGRNPRRLRHSTVPPKELPPFTPKHRPRLSHCSPQGQAPGSPPSQSLTEQSGLEGTQQRGVLDRATSLSSRSAPPAVSKGSDMQICRQVCACCSREQAAGLLLPAGSGNRLTKNLTLQVCYFDA